MDPAYTEFVKFLAGSVLEAKLAYAEHHPGVNFRPETSAAIELLTRALTGIAYRRFPRNRLGQYMVQG